MDLEDVIPYGFDKMVYCVPSGTVVDIDDNGDPMLVTDTTVVDLGRKFYCTEKVFNEIKKQTAKRLS